MEVIFFLIVVFGVVMLYQRSQKKKEDDLYAKVNIIEDETLKISSKMKQSIKKHDIKTVTELRQMGSEDLLELLSCSSDILNVFERRIENIDDGYARYEEFLQDTNVAASRAGFIWQDPKKVKKTIMDREMVKLTPLKERLDEQNRLAMVVFEEDLMGVGSALKAIPEKYRVSMILRKMCEYLSDGETDSWEGCIKIYKNDSYHDKVLEHYADFGRKLGRIEQNTALTAAFAGLTALNTGRIAAKL